MECSWFRRKLTPKRLNLSSSGSLASPKCLALHASSCRNSFLTTATCPAINSTGLALPSNSEKNSRVTNSSLIILALGADASFSQVSK